MSYYIANVSFGKDSLAMLYLLIENRHPINEVVFYDTGMEFEAIYAERDRAKVYLDAHNIRYMELRPKDPFWYSMFARPVKSRKTGQIHKHGYGWCGGSCRWGTTEKTRTIDAYAKSFGYDTVQYIGIAADETARIERNENPLKKMPLVEWGLTEKDCLELCYERGHRWLEGDVELYAVLDRVSCWCCRNKNMKELSAIHDKLPDYWKRLCALEDVLGQMKSKPLPEIADM